MIETLKKERERFERTGKPVVRELELECIHKSGKLHWIEIRARLRRDASGSVQVLGVTRDITERKRLELRQRDLITKLGQAVAENERLLKENELLRGLLPICSGCRRIRGKDNRWWPLEAYVSKKAEAKFTHTICPDCQDVMYDNP